MDTISGPCGSSFPERLLLVGVRLTHMVPLLSQGGGDKFVQRKMAEHLGHDIRTAPLQGQDWHGADLTRNFWSVVVSGASLGPPNVTL